jgi:hypothetical protein
MTTKAPVAESRVSKPWAERGFTAEDAQTWKAAGCTPAGAARFVRLGLSSEQAERWYRVCTDWGWLEPLISSGCPVDEAERWSAAGVPNYRIASLWKRGVTFGQLRPWLSAGFDVDEATAFAAKFTSPDECLGWRDWLRDHNVGDKERTVADIQKSPLTPGEAARWVTAGIPAEFVPSLGGVGRLDEVIGLPAHTGFSFGTLVTLLRAGESLTDLASPSRPRSQDDDSWAKYSGARIADWEAWRVAGCNPSSTKAFIGAGVQRPAEASEWLAHRFSIGSVRDYRAVGLSPYDVSTSVSAAAIPATGPPPAGDSWRKVTGLLVGRSTPATITGLAAGSPPRSRSSADVPSTSSPALSAPPSR